MRLNGFSAPQCCESSQPAARARATTRTVRDTSALKLTLKTAEGDTVEISLEARSLRHIERSSARAPGGRVSQQQDSRFDSFSAAVNVNGDLSGAELEDIQSLLQVLASGAAAPECAESIAAYQYSYQHAREVSQCYVEIYG